ncbi:MAG: hypothetical protein ACP5O1_05385 [Phycisphaerae bacterium]
MFSTRCPILLDVNTQRDLFDPAGKYPLAKAAALIDPLERAFSAVKRLHTPVISTRLHNLTQIDPPPSEPICVPGTTGYQKLPFTLCDGYEEMPLDCGTDFPVDGFLRTQQHIFDLPDANPFDSPRLDRLLSETQTPLWIIVGGPLESVVRMIILGLIQRRQPLAVVRDCCGLRDALDFDLAMRKLESKNVHWLTVDEAAERLAAKPNRSRSKHSASVFIESLRRPARSFKSPRKTTGYRH